MNKITSFRISGLDRVMECEGSPQLESPKFPPHPAAAEGTAAGAYLRHLIEKTPVIPATDEDGTYFDEDMKHYALQTLPLIVPGAKCETEVRWQTRSGIWLIGHYDASAIDGTDLVIQDYKYGWNIVDVCTKKPDGTIKPNWQLIGYAICEMKRLNPAVTHVRMEILQPRPHHEEGVRRVFRIPVHELWAYAEQIEVKMDAIARGSMELVTGKHCKYCPHAGGSCPAFNRTFFAAIDHVLTHHQKDSVTNKEIAIQLDLISRAQDVLKIKLDSLNQLAVHRIAAGEIIPGYITEKNYGDRKWKPWVSPEVIAAMSKGIKVTETKMLSPNQAEKVGVPKELVKDLVERHFIGQKLVRKDAGEIGAEIFKNKPVGGM